MKKGMLKINKIFCLMAFVAFGNSFFAQKPNIKEMPSASFNVSKNILILDDDNKNLNLTKLDSKFIPMGTQEISRLWTISGVEGKDWEFISSKNSDNSIQLKFKKIGSYTVSIGVTYSYKLKLKKGQQEADEEEDEAFFEVENAITVTNNLDELTQLFAENNFIKLIKRSEDYRMKPKYSGDPTPLIFLAKGYYGLYTNDIKDPLFPDPYSSAVSSISEALEIDQNGILNMPIHKMWLTNFQNEILKQGIIYKLDETDGYPTFLTLDPKNKKNQDKIDKNLENKEELIEGIEESISISKNPLAYRLLEAAIRYNGKQTKEANAIYKLEIPNIMKLEKIDDFTEADMTAFRNGFILSAQVLRLINKGGDHKICEFYDKVDQWFETELDFNKFYKDFLNECKEVKKIDK